MTEGIIAFLCNGPVSGQVLYQILHFKMYFRFPDVMANPAQVLKSGAGKLGVCEWASFHVTCKFALHSTLH